MKKLTYHNDGRFFVTTIGGKVTSFVNIRKSYTSSSAVVGRMWAGDMLPLMVTGYIDNAGVTWFPVRAIDGSNGYVSSQYTKQIHVNGSAPSTADCQKLINNLTANDVKVHDSLLRCAAVMVAKKQDGCNVNSYADKLKLLNDRLAERQNALKKNSWLNTSKTVTSRLWNSYKDKYKKVLSWFGISAWPLIVAGCVAICAVVGGVGFFIYYTFKPKYTSSVEDLKESQLLEKALQKLTPAERKEVEKDLNKQIDDAYNQGKTDGTFGGAFSIVKPLAFGALGFIVVTKFIDWAIAKKGK